MDLNAEEIDSYLQPMLTNVEMKRNQRENVSDFQISSVIN